MTDTLAGKLLVAMPRMSDPRFARAVVMMCAHDREHAMGVVINKPKADITLSDVLGHLGLDTESQAGDRVVLDGGPVRPDRGYVLHSPEFTAGEATQSVTAAISLTATRDVLEAVAGENTPHRFVLALGCSGWGAGQLENELKQNAWLVVDADAAIVFDDEHSDKWERAIKSLGFEPAQLMGDMGSA